MRRLQEALQQDKKILSIYFTAGYPNLEDTIPVLKSLEENGVDLVEIGLPFSDPLADGPTIQASSTQALKNGMSTSVLFDQLQNVRDHISIPLIIMGYFNPILQYGVEAFCEKCAEIGIDGLILPDLPLEEYNLHYKQLFEKHNLAVIFLITPQTSIERIHDIDKASKAFIYMVSSASTTGGTSGFSEKQESYFNKIEGLQLKSQQLVGFGINNSETFLKATSKAKGAIIGSAFISMLSKEGLQGIPSFVKQFK